MTTTAVKERPIIFSSPMVRAILEGRKTQTRRVITEAYKSRRRDGVKLLPELLTPEGLGGVGHACPFGIPGDRLWVKETYANSRGDDSMPTYYRANGHLEETQKDWKPSIFMPRWASRITLEIVGVRVELLKQISREDRIAEGFSGSCVEFASTWDALNGKRGFPFDGNPWVWVITFKRLEDSK